MIGKLKDQLTKDPLSTNIIVGILMLMYGIQWVVISHDQGYFDDLAITVDHITLFSATGVILLTIPFLLLSLQLIFNRSEQTIKLFIITSGFVIAFSMGYMIGLFFEPRLRWSFSQVLFRFPFVIFGVFSLMQMYRVKHMKKDMFS